jgi:hypothetical protein
MREKKKLERVGMLWYAVLAKAKGAVLVLDRFSNLTRRIYLFGTSQKLDLKYEAPPVVKWYIIIIESPTYVAWNVIVMFLLLYTAIFTPYRASFV